MEITNYRCSSCAYESHCYIILKHHIKVTHEARDSTNYNETFENDTKICACDDCKYENELRAVLSGYFQTQQKPEDEIVNFVDVGEGFEINTMEESDNSYDEAMREVSAASFLEEEIRIEVVDSDQEDKSLGNSEVVLSEESENNNLCDSQETDSRNKRLANKKVRGEKQKHDDKL